MAQCKAPQRYNLNIWYCTLERGHSSPHQNQEIARPEERVWDDARSLDVMERYDVANWQPDSER